MKEGVVRKSVFVQKGGRFANTFFACKGIGREKSGVILDVLTTFRLFFLHSDSICECATFLPLFHVLCPFKNLYYVVAETAKFTGDTTIL